MTNGLTLTFTGNPTINIGLTADQVQNLITAAMEATVSAPLTTIDEALIVLQASVATLTADEAANRAAFDALATVVRAFISSVSTAGTLTAEQAIQAQSILDSIGAADAAEVTQASDEAALQAEVPSA